MSLAYTHPTSITTLPEMPCVGQTLGRYEIVGKLGEGGMGVVYKARDVRLNRYVALKLLHSSLLDTADQLHQIAKEARTASALNHPNIITVHDIATNDDCAYLVLEYVPGKTLGDLIPPGTGLPIGQALP